MENQLVSKFICELTILSHIWPNIILHSMIFAKKKEIDLIVKNLFEILDICVIRKQFAYI